MVCHVYDNWVVGKLKQPGMTQDHASSPLHPARPCLEGSNSNTALHFEPPLLVSKSKGPSIATVPLDGLEFQI